MDIGAVDGYLRVDIERIGKLAREQGLAVFLSAEPPIPREYHVHIGIPIHQLRATLEDECTCFDVTQILTLVQDPSLLLQKLKKLGITASPSELRLYGVTYSD